MAVVKVPAKTYHEMYQHVFKDCQDRIKKSQENYIQAAERKKAALEASDENEILKQTQIQEALNADMSRLTDTMNELLERAKEFDDTPLPSPVSYELYNEDRVGVEFQEVGKKPFRFLAHTKVTQIYNRSCRAELPDMRKSKKRARLDRAVNYMLNFHTGRFIKFLSEEGFYDMRSAFIGETGISSMFGKVNGPGIQDITKGNNVTIRLADRELKLTAPIAVAADNGAIWRFNAGAFEWFWYKKH
jgi:hypothetical protein